MLVVAALMVASGRAYSGTTPDLPLSLMSHKTWTARDGAPQGVRSLAQAPDGTLWIGTDGGLFNFDGLAFKGFRPPPGEPDLPAGTIFAVRVARDGALWAATLQGVARIASGHVTRYEKVEGKPASATNFLSEASDGSMWCSGIAALYRIAPDGTAHAEPTPLPMSAGSIGGNFIDSSNTLWIGQAGRLYRRPLAGSAYAATDVHIDLTWKFAEAPDGSFWITDVDTKANIGRHQRVDRSGTLVARVPDQAMAFSIMPVPDGSLLIGSQGHGLLRFHEADTILGNDAAAKPNPEAFTRADGLAATETRALMIDTDGSIWAGGRHGLDRFRPAQLTPFLPERGKEGDDGWSVCANRKGDVWVSYVNGLYKKTDGAPKTFPDAFGSYLFCEPDGDAWMINSRAIWNLHDDRIEQIAAVPGIAPYAYKQVVSTADGTLFAFVSAPAAAPGIWTYKEGQWTLLVPGRPPIIEYLDSQDRLWVGGHEGIVGLPLEDRRFSTGSPGLEDVHALLESRHGMFAGGANGLAVFRETRFELLAFENQESVRGTGGIVESRDGDLWLNASRGVVHLRSGELEAGLEDPHYRMKSELVTEGEFVGPVSLLSKSTAARDAGGNLWFATLNGVFHFDPEHLAPDTRAPIVSIRSLAVDGATVAAGATIGPNPQTLVIQYLGVNLTAPERVTYQYRLEGLEDAWQDAGHRSEAIYTQLPPGTYTFRVKASNDDGAWTPSVSAPAFIVAPAFYQTVWFKLLFACLGLLTLFGVFALRLRAVARGIGARAEARAEERIRIARELHDTLLQGVQGLLLSVHVAAEQTPDGIESKHTLRRALSTADRIIIEGRDRLSSLRAERLTEAELISAIQNVGHDLATGPAVRCDVRRSGTDATLQSHVGDEIFYIAREALTNAFRHAGATKIDVEVDYGRQFFRLTCVDDGRGFDPGVHEKAGHFGLRGMAERATRLGGCLDCDSEPSHGTRISIRIPAFRAYRRSSRLMFHLRQMCSLDGLRNAVGGRAGRPDAESTDSRPARAHQAAAKAGHPAIDTVDAAQANPDPIGADERTTITDSGDTTARHPERGTEAGSSRSIEPLFPKPESS